MYSISCLVLDVLFKYFEPAFCFMLLYTSLRFPNQANNQSTIESSSLICIFSSPESKAHKVSL